MRVVRAHQEGGISYKGICNLKALGICMGLEEIHQSVLVHWTKYVCGNLNEASLQVLCKRQETVCANKELCSRSYMGACGGIPVLE